MGQELEYALLAVNMIAVVAVCMKFHEITEEEPALYLWIYMTKPWVVVMALCAVQFSVSMVIARLIDDPWFSVPAAIAAYAILIVSYRRRHHLSGINLSRNVYEFLPGSCPVCTLYRAGVYYKFRKHGDPVPDHPECEEKPA